MSIAAFLTYGSVDTFRALHQNFQELQKLEKSDYVLTDKTKRMQPTVTYRYDDNSDGNIDHIEYDAVLPTKIGMVVWVQRSTYRPEDAAFNWHKERLLAIGVPKKE